MPSTKDTWLRSEFKDREEELCSRREYEQEQGLKNGYLNHRFRDYADRAPAVVVKRFRSGVYPENVFVRTELEAFNASIDNSDRPRTRAEVAAAEVARRELTVEEATIRRDNRKKEAEAAQRNLDRHESLLKQARETLEIERRLEADT